ncbi:MAG: MarR family transcriptional regulator [Altererythrobacter sp.]|uniref:MarR family winged helix-turn-helix transcriptional regulator n=1 Tax=uncultured Altererythrobacter sp. TaxID=500840 RepID=UPI00183497AF|nr:MarR family transcriptional regulator [uncultured Altererythrobacter sp.]MBT8389027.1 MarR family transcriptional regulator [Altererythrobacter sp.]MBT8431089.1 MarR family transcriptional regulator [Altererythrobacter sp.]NNE49030.1 MarR family transcriptional regulator [Altererythrobacter sp.]NNF95242.1 MarR family transcriptional regulator [Altererythrobacter sp.]
MTSPDPLAFKVLNEIGIIDQLASHAFTQVLPRNMTIAQFSVLNHFVRLEHDFRTPAQLASAFQVSRPTMSNTLARLERAGLVQITPDPDDGRGKRVSITETGRAMRDDCIARLGDPLARMQAHVPSELIEKLDPLLTQLREILDQMRD